VDNKCHKQQQKDHKQPYKKTQKKALLLDWKMMLSIKVR